MENCCDCSHCMKKQLIIDSETIRTRWTCKIDSHTIVILQYWETANILSECWKCVRYK